MGCNSSADLQEESAGALALASLHGLGQIEVRFSRVTPILTPRFIPSGTNELLNKLHAIQQKQKLPAQSHLLKNQYEAEWGRELCPNVSCYSGAYDALGLSGGKTARR